MSRALHSRRPREGVRSRQHGRPDAERSASRWVRWLAPSLVGLLTVLAFLPTAHNQFVSWDDGQTFLENPHYRGLAWPHLRWMWTTFHMGHYSPLTWMTFGADYVLWGLNPAGYHLTSLLLHAATAVAFYAMVLRILTSALPDRLERPQTLRLAAGFAALLFALHPLRVEAVAWVTGRRDALLGLFSVLTVLAYLRSCERTERGRSWYGLSAALFGCALLSKSMAVSLPLVLLILDVYPLRRLGGSVGWWSRAARRVYLEKAPFVLLAAAIGVLAFKARAPFDTVVSLAQLSLLDRLVISAYGLSFYLWKTIVPLDLSPLYVLPRMVNPWEPPFILSYATVLAVTAVAVALRRRLPGLAAAWAAYVVVLFPVLGIFQNGPQIAADRYTYVACLGWATLAGAALLASSRTALAPPTGTRATSLLAIVALGVVVGLGVLTWKQVQVWHDSDRLWRHALALDPNSPFAQNNFGFELARRDKLSEAVEHFEQALRLKPDYAVAHNNRGWALGRQGKQNEAIEHFQRALRIKPQFAEAQNNWGVALTRQGKVDEAIDHFEQALRINPQFAEAHNGWGVALARQERLAEAVEHFEQALRIKPELVEARNNRHRALALQGKTTQVIGR